MKKDRDNILSLGLRYLILVAVAIPNFFLFYFVFTPLTIYPVYFFLGLLFDVSFLSNIVILVEGSLPIELIEACIAGSAYYLLLILNLSTPSLKLKTRIYAIGFSFAAFLIINILRIFVLSMIAVLGLSFFDITHKVFWYLISTLFVVAVWFTEVKIFKIKFIPIYSDLKSLYNKSNLKK